MSIRNTVAVIVHHVENGNVSYYGNPSKIFHTSRGMFQTMANAGFVYGMQSNESWEGQKVELTLTPSGRVTNARKLTKDGLKDVVTNYRFIENDRI